MKPVETYEENGVTVTVLPARKLRKSEKTFQTTRYSVANMGRKQITMKNTGLKGKGGK